MFYGYIIILLPKLDKGSTYLGVDNDPWPLGISTQFFQNRIDLDMDPLLVDKMSADGYLHICLEKGLDCRMLYCEVFDPQTEKSYCSNYEGPMAFLGYDVAYAGGDFFSSINNDILWDNGFFHKQDRIKVNNNGLFTTLDEAICFWKERKHELSLLLQKGDFLRLEQGEFWIYRIFA